MAETEDKPKLTAKQLKFCQEYIVDLNGTQAAIRAGYSENSASEISSENLRKPQIEAYISELQGQAAERTKITADRVLIELGKLAFSDASAYYDKDGNVLPLSDMPEGATSAIQSIKFDAEGNPEEIKLVDKKGALDLIGKHHALFTERVHNTHSGPSGEPLVWTVLPVSAKPDDASDKGS